ncbi:hypothetical protein SADUNF_Sadunf08G0079700 [Salix dunnii]|uniref:MATH domain-containing protein n=1 Tax=Salix dunnii TaxID=1413687 RepID=A0A835MXK8_9ROSI|nr:hypothetical protein SADUNF_Sadunf08G0079700 [Salix dunnii]
MLPLFSHRLNTIFSDLTFYLLITADNIVCELARSSVPCSPSNTQPVCLMIKFSLITKPKNDQTYRYFAPAPQAIIIDCRKILLYPKGKDSRMGTHLSLYLALDLETLPAGCTLCVDYTLRIVDQVKDRQLDLLGKAKHWFGASSSESGWKRFVSLDYIYQSNHAYVIQDICMIEAEVIVLGIGSAF